MTEVIPTWGYRGDESRLFHLKEGDGLPEGWFDSPAGALSSQKPGDVTARSESGPEGKDGLPEGWREFHWRTRVKMAKDLLGGEFNTAQEADEALQRYEAEQE